MAANCTILVRISAFSKFKGLAVTKLNGIASHCNSYISFLVALSCKPPDPSAEVNEEEVC